MRLRMVDHQRLGDCWIATCPIERCRRIVIGRRTWFSPPSVVRTALMKPILHMINLLIMRTNGLTLAALGRRFICVFSSLTWVTGWLLRIGVLTEELLGLRDVFLFFLRRLLVAEADVVDAPLI